MQIKSTIDFPENSANNLTARSLWIDHLRAFVIILVVAHHAMLSYTTWAYYNKDAYILSTHPIVDQGRWQGFDVLVNFNDSFFMSLMFLLSGIFVIKGIQKKGNAAFIRDRFYRLFVLFIIGVAVLMPIAYYPAFHVAHPEGSIWDHVVDFFTTEGWPVGPPWFLWVLFLFNVILALVYNPLASFFARASNYAATLANKPLQLFLWLLVIGLVLYIPAMYLFGAESWTGFGPFDFQKSRLLLYFGYFIVGCIVGAKGTNEGILGAGSVLQRTWLGWLISAVLTFTIFRAVTKQYGSLGEQSLLGPDNTTLNYFLVFAACLYRVLLTLSATLTTFAFISFFKRFVNKQNPVWNSLAANSFGIYLLHYVFVVWLQYLLLPVTMSPVVKFSVVFITSFALSWLISSLLRRIPIVKAYV